MTLAQEIRAYLESVNPEALFIGENEEHDSALIGVTYIKREEEFVHIAMYQYESLVESFAKQFEDSEDPEQDAVEWIDYNVASAYVGKYTPFIVYN
jgi:hypothetical protein